MRFKTYLNILKKNSILISQNYFLFVSTIYTVPSGKVNYDNKRLPSDVLPISYELTVEPGIVFHTFTKFGIITEISVYFLNYIILK